ncbi:hypothetical protein LTR56_006212 [Elasticomyces elasticus]|nr:hypothetical protein LTR56_006212 [Elasticomyces elasticus]KAK3666579.1 hypothetical protein LTR22_002523 [Elasticomyces elasticus]KAK4928288.1 hypothetical protein LTR49_004965 [Elasticomyces elasticus]KAK5763851.1 hypothetical protein LTS12_005969 [Elasticomyces elasticus]
MKHIHGFTVELKHGDMAYDEHRTLDDSKDIGCWREDSRLDGKCNTHMSRMAIARKLDSDQDEAVTVNLEHRKGFSFYSANAIYIAVRIGIDEHQCRGRDGFMLKMGTKAGTSNLLPESHSFEIPIGVMPPPCDMVVGSSRASRKPKRWYWAPPGVIAVFVTRGKMSEDTIRRVQRDDKPIYIPTSKEMAEFSPIRGRNGKTQCLEYHIRPKGFDFYPMATKIRRTSKDSGAQSTEASIARQIGENPAETETVSTASQIDLNTLAPHDGTESALSSGSPQHNPRARRKDDNQRPVLNTVQDLSTTSSTTTARARMLASETAGPDPTTSAYIQQQSVRHRSLPVQPLEFETLSSEPAKTPTHGPTCPSTVEPFTQRSTQVVFLAPPANGECLEIRTPRLESAEPNDAANELCAGVPSQKYSPQVNTPAPSSSGVLLKPEVEKTQQIGLQTQQPIDVDLTLSDDEGIVVIKQEAGAAHTHKRRVVALDEDDAEDDDELEAQKRVMAIKRQKIDMEKQGLELEMEEIEFERKMREREREKKRRRAVVKLEGWETSSSMSKQQIEHVMQQVLARASDAPGNTNFKLETNATSTSTSTSVFQNKMPQAQGVDIFLRSKDGTKPMYDEYVVPSVTGTPTNDKRRTIVRRNILGQRDEPVILILKLAPDFAMFSADSLFVRVMTRHRLDGAIMVSDQLMSDAGRRVACSEHGFELHMQHALPLAVNADTTVRTSLSTALQGHILVHFRRGFAIDPEYHNSWDIQYNEKGQQGVWDLPADVWRNLQSPDGDLVKMSVQIRKPKESATQASVLNNPGCPSIPKDATYGTAERLQTLYGEDMDDEEVLPRKILGGCLSQAPQSIRLPRGEVTAPNLSHEAASANMQVFAGASSTKATTLTSGSINGGQHPHQPESRSTTGSIRQIQVAKPNVSSTNQDQAHPTSDEAATQITGSTKRKAVGMEDEEEDMDELNDQLREVQLEKKEIDIRRKMRKLSRKTV